ncbi:MAG: hypothetical protein MUQ32_07860, partial [Chloroflexi bacterium]|nr:hypothetical protein [Chloroflexota bacterium]
ATHFVAAYRAAPDGPEGEAVGTQARIALIATADRAERLGALSQAIDALGEAAEVSRDAAERGRILERLGYLATEASRSDEAVTALDDAIHVFEAAGDRVGVIRATAWLMLAHAATTRIAEAVSSGDTVKAEGEALVEVVLAAGPVGARDRAEAAAIFAEAMGRVEFRAQRHDTSIEWCDRALRIAEPLRLDEVIAMALTTRGTALSHDGRAREGTALLEGALLDARSHGQNLAALRAANNLASNLTLTDPRACLDRIREALALAHRLGFRAFDGYLAGNAVGAADSTGEWDLVTGWIAEMLESFPDRPESEWLRFCLQSASPWRGGADLALVEHLLEEAQREGDYQSEINALAFMIDVAVAAGRHEEAVQQAERLLAVDRVGMVAVITARAGLHGGRPDIAGRALEAAGQGFGGVHDHDLATIRAGLAAVEGRPADAIPLYRSAIAGFREYGVRFSLALAIFDMLTFIGPDDPAVRPLLDEGRAILSDLGATVVLDRFDVLVGGGTNAAEGSSQDDGGVTEATARR